MVMVVHGNGSGIVVVVMVVVMVVHGSSSSIELYWHDIKIFYILPKRFKFSLVQITLIV